MMQVANLIYQSRWPSLCLRRTMLVQILAGLLFCLAPVVLGAQELSTSATSGPVAVTVRLSPEEPVIGDEVTLVIEVKAEKDVEVLMPEFDEVISGFRIAEWIPKTSIQADGRQVLSQTYRFQTTASGQQSVPPMLVEFVDRRPGKQSSPDDYDAYEIITDRIDFTVQSVLPGDSSLELKPPLGELELPSRRLESESLAGLILVLVLLLGLGFAVWMWLRKARQVRKLNAYEVARQKLQRLIEARSSAGASFGIEEFFVEISAIIRRYLEDRFELRAPELTTDEFLQLASGEGRLSREHQKLLEEFLQRADLVKFAGVGATDVDVQRSIDLAVQFLEDTRRSGPDSEYGSQMASGGERTEPQAVEQARQQAEGSARV